MGEFALNQPVDPVKGSGLVTFRQRWIVEHRVDEVIDRAAEGHHRLPDVDQLAGAFADDMHTQQFVILAVKNQLEHADGVADDLSARDLFVIGFANFVGDARLGQFFFVGADGGYLGNGIDAVGEKGGEAVMLDVEGVASRHASLFHGGGRQAGETNHIAYRVDIRDLGLIVLINLDAAAKIGRDIDVGQTQCRGRAFPPDGVKRFFGDDLLAALQAGLDAGAITRIAGLNAAHALAQAHRYALLPHVIDQGVNDFVIDKGQQTVGDLNQGDAHAQRGEHTGVFAADDASADHGQGPGQLVQLEQAIAGENGFAIKRDIVWFGDGCANGDDDVARGHFVFAFFVEEIEMHRVLIDEGRDAGEELDTIALQLMFVDFDLVANDMVGAQQQVVHGDMLLDLVGSSIDGALPETGQVQNRFAQGF